jgi:hypothetical protein
MTHETAFEETASFPAQETRKRGDSWQNMALPSGSSARKGVRVQIPASAPANTGNPLQ